MDGTILMSAGEELDTRSDETLAALARESDSDEAFRLLYTRHRDEVFRFLLRLLGNEELARDATQETFFRVYRFLDRYDPARPFRPWLLRVAHNAGVNTLRKGTKGRGPSGDAAGRAGSDRVARVAADREAAHDVQAALAALDPETRALLLQRFGLGLTQVELAEVFEVTERTIRNRLRNALSELTRSLLAQRGQGA